tara:strand:- start:237 stop:458 length:222 start_codon:yes stop_codon:yes gene_type:complete
LSKVTAPLELSLYRLDVVLPLELTNPGSSETKKPKSVVLVETSPENDAKGEKSKVEVKRELKSFLERFFMRQF